MYSTYNVKLRRGRVTTVAVEKQWVLHIVSVFVSLIMRHAMRIRHIVICSLSRSTILFSHIFSYAAQFSKTSYGTQNVFWFSL
jgi:hypothetical protein